jgi:mono/diheme cytochrome c family protein
MRWVVAFLSLVFAVAVTTAAVGAQRRGGDPKLAARKNPVAANAASITAGRALYNKNCRHCHGLRGKGDGPLAPKNPKPADLTDAKWDHGSSDGEIFAVIWNGAPAPMSEMKPMKGTLTEKNVWEIINYLRSMGPARGAAPKAATK